MPSTLRLNHPRRLVCGAIWRVPMKIANRCWSMHEQTFATLLAPVTLTLARWPSYTNLIISWRYTGRANAKKIQFVCHGFRKLSSDRHTYIRQTNRQTDRQICPRNYIPRCFAGDQLTLNRTGYLVLAINFLSHKVYIITLALLSHGDTCSHKVLCTLLSVQISP